MLTTKERVQNGIKLLNEKSPDWRSKINVAELNISDCKQCIIAQIGRELLVSKGLSGIYAYEKCLLMIGLDYVVTPRYGFDINVPRTVQGSSNDYEDLQKEWLAQF